MDIKTEEHILANNCNLRDENDRLKKELTGLKVEHNRLIDEYCEVMGDNRELKEELRQQNDDLVVFNLEADERIKCFREKVSMYLAQNCDLKAQNESLNKDVGDLTVAVEEVIEERDDALDSLETVRENYMELYQEKMGLEDLLEYTKDESFKLGMVEELLRKSDEVNEGLMELVQDQAQEIENLESLMESEDQMDAVVDLFEPYEEEEDGCPLCKLLHMVAEGEIEVI